MPTIPTCEPSEIVIGATLRWLKYLPGYLPADGWTLKYYFRRAAGPGFDIVTIADGTSHMVDNFETSEVVDLEAGGFAWQAWVENDAEVKHFIEQGATTIKPGLIGTDADEVADIRSENEKQLAAVKVALGKAVEKNAAEYQIANRMKREHSLQELIALHDRLVGLVNQERLTTRVRNGGSLFQTVRARFV